MAEAMDSKPIQCEFESHYRYVKIAGMPLVLTDLDKTVGLLFSGVAMVCLSSVVIIHLVTDAQWTPMAAIMVISWWFGASMTWLFDKHYQHYKKHRLEV